MEQHWTVRDDETDISHDKLLGQGGYGEVHKMTNNRIGKCFARKILRVWAGNTEKEIENEVNKVRKLCQSSHPNIVQVIQIGLLKPDSVFHYIDMELCDFTLEKYIYGDVPHLTNWTDIRCRPIESRIAEITGIAEHIIQGLIFIHELDQVHRDLSPQNVLYSLESKTWKIADFGLTTEATSHRLVTSRYGRGKPGYRAPELVSERSGYNKKTDMWALGCIIGELIMGQKPFPGDYAVIEYSMHHNSPPFSKDHEEIILLEVFFVDSLLSRDPCSRPSATQLASLGQIPMFLLQSGISVSDESYREVALDALPRTDRMDLALVFVEAIFASNPHFFTSDSAVKFVQNLLASAISKRDRNLTRMLLKVHKTNVTSVAFEAVAKGDVDMVQFLLESGVNITELNKENETLLHCAALAGHAEASKLLLESGVNVHATVEMVLERSRWSATVLHYAAVGGNPDVVKLLLAAGAEVHDAKPTASNLAALNGHVDVLKVLLSQTTQGFGSVISEDHYDSGWIQRYWSAWNRQFETPSFKPLTKWEMYRLPLPFRDIGEDWSIIFNKDSTGTKVRLSHISSPHLGMRIYCVCFSKNAEYVAAATRETVMIFDTRSGTEIAKLLLDNTLREAGKFRYREPAEFCKCICFGPSGNQDIITAVDSAVISLWDISSRTVAVRCLGHQSRILSLEVPRIGPTYLVASRDVRGIVKVWDMRSAQALLTLDHRSEAMAIAPNGKILAIAAFHYRHWPKYAKTEYHQSSVLFFSITTGVLLQKFNLDCWISALAFSRNGEELITASRSSIRVWRISETGKPAQSRIFGKPWKVISDTVYGYEIRGVEYSSSGNTFTTAHENRVLFWSTASHRPLAILRLNRTSGPLNEFECVPASNSEFFATGNDAGTLHIWKLSENGEANR